VSAPQHLDELSRTMQRALLRAAHQGIPAHDPRSVSVHPSTLAALEQHGLVARRTTRKGGEQWRTTDVGRGLIAAHAPRLLTFAAHPRGSEHGYTDDPAKAMRDEPEAVDESVDASNRRSAHAREHEDFRQLVEDRQDWRIEDRLRAVLDDARARGVDVLDRDLRVLRNHVAKLEARVYGPADRLTAE
jgi:hypothetical protein